MEKSGISSLKEAVEKMGLKVGTACGAAINVRASGDSMPYPCMLLEVPTKNDQAQMQYAKLVELILEWNYFNQLKRWTISLSTAASTPNMAVYELAPHDKNPGKTLELARRLNSETDRLAEFIEARLPQP